MPEGIAVHRGFILHPTYRIEAGHPIVHLFGRLEDGRSFLVRDRRLVPHFFIRAQDVDAARPLGAGGQAPGPWTPVRGQPVVRVEVEAPDRTPPLREALAGAGIPVLEADVRFAMRYLIDHGVRGALEIEGAPAGGHGVDVVFQDPVVRPSGYRPEDSLLRLV